MIIKKDQSTVILLLKNVFSTVTAECLTMANLWCAVTSVVNGFIKDAEPMLLYQVTLENGTMYVKYARKLILRLLIWFIF